jgi:hypothetical protein
MRTRTILALLAAGAAAMAIEYQFHPAFPVSALIGTLAFAGLMAFNLARRQPAPQ